MILCVQAYIIILVDMVVPVIVDEALGDQHDQGAWNPDVDALTLELSLSDTLDIYGINKGILRICIYMVICKAK